MGKCIQLGSVEMELNQLNDVLSMESRANEEPRLLAHKDIKQEFCT